MNTTSATAAELYAAWDRVRVLRLRGWTFAKAMATPLLRLALEKSAVAHRRADQPQQPALL